MKEYIERAQLLKNLGYDETRRADVLPGSTFDIVLKEPAADVAEVRHGHWEFLGPNRLIKSCMCGTCSVCHNRSTYIVNTAICPNCGARMGQENKHKVRCAKCGKIKEMVCTVDGKPWCEDCFDKAMGSGTKHEAN